MMMRKHLALMIASVVLMAGCGAAAPAGSSASQASSQTPAPMTAPPSLPAGRAIPFRTIAHGFRLGGGLPKPTLMIAVDAAGRTAIRDFVSPEHQALLETIDLRQEALLVVFRETMPSGGYAITVNTITLADGEIIVDATLSEDSTLPRIEAATLPYHLVTVDINTLPLERNLRYRLVSAEKVLAEGELSLQ